MSTPSPIVRRRRLGSELRRLRESAGLTGDQVIERLGWASASKLSRLENGKSRPALGDVENLLRLYEVEPRERAELLNIAREAAEHTKSWLRAYTAMTAAQREYAELEAGCAEICEYAPVIVPGLLQTAAYARVRFLSARQLGRRHAAEQHEPEAPDTEVAARLARQRLLSGNEDPPRYQAVLEEAALSTRACPPDVLHEQLQHLRRIAALPNVTLRVLPATAVIGNWYLPETAFSIYRFAEPEDPSAVAVEALRGNLMLEESALDDYAQVFEWLCAAARSPAESLEWITEAAWRTARGMEVTASRLGLGAAGAPTVAERAATSAPVAPRQRRRPRPDDDV